MKDLPAYTRTTPCVGLCSTVYGDLVCRGCKRFSHEIIDWNRYDALAKAAVWQRLEQLLEQVVMARVEVVSVLALHAAVERLQVKVALDSSLALKVLRVIPRLEEGALAASGLRLRSHCAELSVKQLRDELDSAYFELSCAYHERRVGAPG
ncbi:DUF1289 domain-containing protein [Halopseudomonas sabulinigri]|uniref:DUF1289 domain-containing protein n=1 Tax=Halopseudomonas sabulinigri TaxID=472181 RepID=A0ABP9ZK51_9GAMM